MPKTITEINTGTFSPMCSSGAFLNIGHSKPRTKLGGGKVYLNDVPVYTGLAAVDIFLGATALSNDDQQNSIYIGKKVDSRGKVKIAATS